jgi:hypothetical protein
MAATTATMSTTSGASRRLQRAVLLLVLPVVVIAAALALTGNARAGESESPSPGSPAGAPPADTSSTTSQSANAGAAAEQQQPGNVVISIRINSPGNGGAIDQSNTAVGQADASNTAGTSQGAADPGSSLGSATEQAAAALASALQQQPRNIVISIRINSPGDDGPVNQANTAVADAGSANASNTTQGANGGSAGDLGAARVALAAHPRVRPKLNTERRPAPAAASAPAAAAPAPVSHTSEGATTVHAPAAARPVDQIKAAPRTQAARASRGHRVLSGAARATASVPQDAARMLGNLGSPNTAALQSERAQTLTGAVVYTLFAVMLGLALFLTWRYLPATTGLRGWLRL